MMTELMVSFDLDLNRMPLGKVRDRQIYDGLGVLMQIIQKIESNASRESLIESSNRFYSTIPHKASNQDVIESKNDAKKKAEMLLDLKNIQFTYEFLYKTGECGNDILDKLYAKMNVIIEPLLDHKQFQMIKRAFESTKSDDNWQIEQTFKIQRSEEE